MTLENLNTILKNLAAEHLQLNDYYFGSLSQAMSKSNVIAYPCLIATVENVRVQKMLSSFTLKLFFIDKLLPGGENIDDVIADMEAVANDYYLLLTNKDWVKDYIMIDAFNGSIIADRLPDDVAGWVITLDCRSYSALCLDDLPITGTVPTYERCVVEGEQGNIVIIGDNNRITDGQLNITDIANLVNDKTTATFDGCYTVIPINTKAETLITQGYEVIKWKIYGYNQAGSNCTVSVDVQKNSVSMVGSGTMPNLTNAKIGYGVPTGWTTTQLSENDLLTFNVSSNSDATYVNIVLLLKKTS